MSPLFDSVRLDKTTKIFGAVAALAKVDLEIRSRVCTVVVGANGAGKTTLLKLLAGLLRPTSGSITYGGRGASQLGSSLRAAIGLATDEPLCYAELSGRENLSLQARLHRLDRAAERVDQALEALGISAIASRAVRGYSHGERKRLGLARALLHEPHLVLLDEPTAGLDLVGGDLVATQLRRLKARGAIVVLATHDADLASTVGDRVVGLRSGQLVVSAQAPAGPDGWQQILRSVVGGRA